MDANTKWKKRAEKLLCEIPAIFLGIKRKDTPGTAKFFGWLAVVYALSPVDLIPDFIPVLGTLDDLLILPALVALAVRHIPEQTLAECREQSRELWKGGKPKRWLFALPVFVFWALILFWMFRLFCL